MTFGIYQSRRRQWPLPTRTATHSRFTTSQFRSLSGLIELLDPPKETPKTELPTHLTIWNPLKQRQEVLVPLRNVDSSRLRFGDSVLFHDDSGAPVVTSLPTRKGTSKSPHGIRCCLSRHAGTFKPIEARNSYFANHPTSSPSETSINGPMLPPGRLAAISHKRS